MAEDEAGLARLQDEVLTRAGHQVTLAADGQAALALFERDPRA